MPLNEHHQLTIIQDILTNHQLDCCGTTAECQQVERLIQSLLEKQVDENIKSTLLDVYNYCQHGQYTKDLNEHIHQNQENLSLWIDNINNYNNLT